LPLGGRKTWDDWAAFSQLSIRRGVPRAALRDMLEKLAQALREHAGLPHEYSERVPAAAGILDRTSAAWARGLQRLERHLG